MDAHSQAPDGFFLAAFSIDGNLEGPGRWEASKLSPRWMQLCGELLQAKGPVFEHCWTGSLSHLRTRFTAAQGAALCTFFVRDRIASSFMLLRGDAPAAEAEVSRLFVESLRRLSGSCGFTQALTLSERPLMVVVPLPLESISDQDHALVRELSLHLAAFWLLNPEMGWIA